ncbi:Methylated-DNA--[protein]-cysteine S-methyltransferase [Sulfidibacter corallicola]|uniref:Methylated-DNA--[protein]-cysteine S-methyltransferase n=1 Tax=Sulfidibacter corallicola TaxID=2818388 RepID=A0A8A4U478_SULCO|nr:methylated-DNA--[protein]-cysteine S-methyltransferase [Sulfidibacter corallicola]QTD53555.1 methylated-DNA--[protein]-cysteine S-methyltransferase [Sulfidibacter corallicola]
MAQIPWNQRVWRLVNRIPEGRVASYGQIARLLGEPRKARHVGYALAATPPGLIIPWQRVVNGQGRISFPEHSEKYRRQRGKLEDEGVEFSESGRINLRLFGWQPEG